MTINYIFKAFYAYFPLLAWTFKGEINFLIKDILKVFLFFSTFLFLKQKTLFIMGWDIQ